MVFVYDDLKNLTKDQLIKIILELQTTNQELNKLKDKMNSLEKKFVETESLSLVKENTSNLLLKRVKDLEVKLLKSEQYSRRECLDVSGIKDDVNDENLEDKVCELIGGIGIELDKEKDIQACHRYGRKKTAIIKFSNRKHVHRILNAKSRLPDEIYISETLCPTNKCIRGRCGVLKKRGLLSNVVTKNGMVRIKKAAGDDYIDILGMDNYYDLSVKGSVENAIKKLHFVIDIANEKGKIAALTETGERNLPDPTWYSSKLGKVLSDPKIAANISYAQVWHNDPTKHFFFPHPNHASAQYARELLNREEVWLLNDLVQFVSSSLK